MTTEGKRYPFLFYGANPSDWFDPDGREFSYELCFVEPPPAAARARAEAAFARALGPRATSSSPWLWAGGRWALARVRPTTSKADGARAAFKAAAEALTEVHALTPLEQAALVEAIDLGDDPWDVWTLSERPSPAPGPLWTHSVTLSPGEERPDATPGESDEGPAGEEPAAGAEPAASDDESDDDESDEPAGDEAPPSSSPEGSRESSIAPGRVTLSLIGRAAGRGRSKNSPENETPEAFGEGKVLGVTPAGVTYGWSKQQKRLFAFAWLDGDTLRASGLTSAYPTTDVAIAPDGRSALVAPPDKGELWVVSLEDGGARKLWKHPDGDDYFVDIAWTAEGRAVAADYGSLYVVAPDGQLEKRVGGTSPDTLRSALGGRVLLVADTDGEAGLSVIGAGPTLKLLARFDDGFEIEDATAEPPVVRDDNGRRYELRGLEEALRAAIEGSPDFLDAPDYAEPEGDDLSVPHAPGRVGFVRRRGSERPELPELPDNAGEFFGETSSVLSNGPGRAFGFVRKPRKPLQFAWLEGETLRTASFSHPRYGASLAARPDGGAALATTTDRGSIYEVVFETGEAHKLATGLSSRPDALAYTDGGVALLDSDVIYLYRRSEGGIERIARLAVEGNAIFSALGGRVIVVSGWQEPLLRVYGVSGDELRLLGGLGARISVLFERAGRVFAKLESNNDVYELVGLDEAHRQAFSSRDDETYPPAKPPSEAEESDDESSDDESESSDDESGDNEEEASKPRGSYAVDAPPGQVGLRYIEGFKSPRRPTVPRDVGKLFGGGNAADIFRDVVYGWKKEGRRAFRFAFYRDGSLSETQFTMASPSSSIMALREPDLSAALASTGDDRTLWEVDARTGQARELWTIEGKDDEFYSVDFLADGHYVVLGTDSTYVLAPDGQRARVLARMGINAANVIVTPDARAFVLEGAGSEGLWIIGLGPGGRLKSLGTFGELSPNDVYNDEGRCLVELDDDGWYEITGIAEARRAAFEGGGTFEDPPPYAPSSDDSDDDSDDDDDSDNDGDDESGDDESDDESDDNDDSDGDDEDESDDDESDDEDDDD